MRGVGVGGASALVNALKRAAMALDGLSPCLSSVQQDSDGAAYQESSGGGKKQVSKEIIAVIHSHLYLSHFGGNPRFNQLITRFFP